MYKITPSERVPSLVLIFGKFNISLSNLTYNLQTTTNFILWLSLFLSFSHNYINLQLIYERGSLDIHKINKTQVN